ncbi:hypothetical protein [Opitutus terrae]|uniref:Lipoprotein n=1 Tax=Opitutus terrae (strain DSM 11246 / JCM 15787 / PB90-1) TaxID=452637 RepID=B1ZQF0_OPITP|nr:hypothetical protein [Opitutus terrae]ACB73630.1 hypothetical protein Oter_0340 [Opitutus terrae PB90-1]
MNTKVWPALLGTGLTLLLAGCPSTAIKPPPTPVSGFQAFDSPRDFDPPGRVFRVDQSGVVYGVGDLDVKPRSGSEVTMKFESKSNWSLRTALATMGVAAESVPAQLQAELGRSREVMLGSTKARREYIDDQDKPDAKAQALIDEVGMKPGNRYYVIRETIATDAVEYRTKSAFTANATLNAEIKKLIETKTGLNLGSNSEVSLPLSFDKSMRVWYKTERITPRAGTLGAGATRPQVTLTAATPEEFRVPEQVKTDS